MGPAPIAIRRLVHGSRNKARRPAVLAMTIRGAWFATITGSSADSGQAMAEEFVRNSTGLEGMQELHRQFDAAAASWGAEHGPDSPRAAEFAARIRYLRKLCRRLGRPRVLDLGCATGQVLVELSPLIDAGVGVDISGEMIERARRIAERGKLRFRADDAVRFCNSCSEHFDLVLFVGVLEHLPDQET